MNPVVLMESVTFYYPRTIFAQNRPALHNFNFKVMHGEMIVLQGSNGSGKSTLLKIIAGLLCIQRGHCSVTARKIAYVPQLAIAPPWLTAEQFLSYRVNLLNSAVTEIDRSLELVGLLENKKNCIGQFSQGMVERLSIAQALIGNPELLFLDEPFANLDQFWVQYLQEIILQNKSNNQTIIIAQHYPLLVNVAHRIFRI